MDVAGRHRVKPAAIAEVANRNASIDDLTQCLSRHLHVAEQRNLRHVHQWHTDQLRFTVAYRQSIAVLTDEGSLLFDVQRQRIVSRGE